MAESRTCPRCGANLATENADGLCPRCLIGLNLSNPTEAPTGCDDGAPENAAGKPLGAISLSLAEIAAYFPELEILELLGRGGMGAVYMARQRRLNRLVALKILPPRIDQDSSFAERFTREAQALARLNHRHIVTLYEFGQKENLFYFLMEYVDGVNLRQLLNTSRLSSSEALAIVPQICDALQYAHEQGIVHRDIKPENLLLNKKGEVKVADFGVAKLVSEQLEKTGLKNTANPLESGLTASGESLGTPLYMAPEQLADPLAVDHRADIYSLGVVFYQMLTGELPAGKFEPPSNKVVIDVRLDQVVLRALEKQPARRYQHVSEVRKELDTIQETGNSKGTTSSPAKQNPSRGFSRRFIVIGPATVIILGLLCLIAYQKINHTHISSLGKPESWKKLAPAELLKGRSSSTMVWTGKEAIVFGGEGLNVTFGDGASYELEKNSWTPLVLQGAAPSSRTCASAVWTGSAMIVWGGFGGSDADDINRDDGAKFFPANNVWKPVSKKGAPAVRFGHTALWTGEEMLVWGGFGGSRTQLMNREREGFLNSGGRYNPTNDVWSEISTNGAPSDRAYPAMVWTGSEMIVWGGGNASGELNDGARYDPKNDTWKPMRSEGAPSPRSMPQSVWTGKEMIVWSGYAVHNQNHETFFQDGAKYNPQTDTWTRMSTNGAPKAAIITQSVWTGKELLVWGGVNDTGTSGVKDPKRYVGTGGRYDPARDEWTEISNDDAPAARVGSAMVWTGKGLLVFGGYNGKHLNDAYFYSLKP